MHMKCPNFPSSSTMRINTLTQKIAGRVVSSLQAARKPSFLPGFEERGAGSHLQPCLVDLRIRARIPFAASGLE